MKRFLPRTLGGQLIAVMLLAVALSQGVSLLIYGSERAKALRGVLREECLGRVASAYRLAQATPVEGRAQMLETVGTPLMRHWLSTAPPGPVPDWQRTAREHILKQTPVAGGGAAANNLFAHDSILDRVSAAQWQTLPPDAWLLRLPIHFAQLSEWNGFAFAIRLDDGTWLNTVYAKPAYLVRTTATPGYYAAMAVTAVIFSVAALFIARRVSRPLRHLAQSSERLGRGEELQLLAEEGPDDIRSTTETFNRMQIRLRRFVEDRTKMLAAISHDLRTPITSLRLRVEFIKDPEMKEKLIATLDEMQAMTEVVLAFAREESTVEPTRAVDIDALVESVCDDLTEMGWDVTFAGGDRTPFRCRPDGLKRALCNVIENAVRYGERARVHLTLSPEWLEIAIDDDGPGIPEEDSERVFAPFVRLETSRNRATGGVGLGLAIARSIVRAHGGDIHLSNRPEAGLRVTLRLPQPVGQKPLQEAVPAAAA
ncbi:MAG TPA: ATP-binding protein [Chthoniobacterales bacterium]